ncbi:low-density lipoprotein receptor class A domain-containing protein 1 isoform X2 [Heterocephalus glaber]|uniref:Low-density lipoprotein receptor class A domain-containing protein 1 isoform X2 n=1 Tax=Heterocephalus glaber TaxID=10181 RepID=A0AAX6SG16_HETGA|nr:low-density lipoprotein receptor class A domain-containing protein 1 isoform X2 [Heterocephalus glaber]
MNKVVPQGNGNGRAAAGTKAHPEGEGSLSPSCSRRGACLSALLLLLLAMLAALVALVVSLGLPSRPPGPPPIHSGTQACVTLTNRTGFLCHDQRICVPASTVCDGFHTCPHGEDEDESLCRAVSSSLDTQHRRQRGQGSQSTAWLLTKEDTASQRGREPALGCTAWWLSHIHSVVPPCLWGTFQDPPVDGQRAPNPACTMFFPIHTFLG